MSQSNTRPIHSTYRDRKRPRSHHHHHRQERSFRPAFSKQHHRKDNTAAIATTTTLCSVCQQEPKPKYKCPKCRATYCSIVCCRQHKEKGCTLESQPFETSTLSTTTTTTTSDTTFRSKYITNNTNQFSESVTKRKKDQHKNHENDLEEGWNITNDMKTRLHQSEWLQQELQDVGLRQLLIQLYEASNVVVVTNNHHHKRKYQQQQQRNGIESSNNTEQEQLFETMKQENPQFKLFLDKLLVLTGILEISQSTTTNDPPQQQQQVVAQFLSRELDDDDHDDDVREHLTLSSAKGILPGKACDIRDCHNTSNSDEEDSSSSSLSSSSDEDTDSSSTTSESD